MNSHGVVLNGEMKKEFYADFLKLYVFLVLQNVITTSVALADNIMLGTYSEVSLSGVTIINQIQFVFQQLILALSDGVVIFGSRYWGSGKTEPIAEISSVALKTALGIAALLFTAVSFFPMQVTGLFTTNAGIISEGADYLKIIRFTYFFFAVTQILLATLRSEEIVSIALKLSVMALLVNCMINYVLIFGHFGAPEMGVTGAAIGTLIARMLETLVLILYIVNHNSHLKISLHVLLTGGKGFAGAYFIKVFPLLINAGLWGMNIAFQTGILGHMGSTAIAANSAASTLFLMVKSMAVGAAAAASVMIGKEIGKGDRGDVKAVAGNLQKIFVVIGLVSGVLLFFLRIPVLGIYRLSPETIRMADHFLIILSVVDVGMSYQMPTNSGIVKGGGNTSFVAKVDLISIWVIVIPLSLFMAFVVKASPEAVVCCLNADQIFKCIPAFLEVHYGNWVRVLVKEDK